MKTEMAEANVAELQLFDSVAVARCLASRCSFRGSVALKLSASGMPGGLHTPASSASART